LLGASLGHQSQKETRNEPISPDHASAPYWLAIRAISSLHTKTGDAVYLIQNLNEPI
jgi:hypothetical protein